VAVPLTTTPDLWFRAQPHSRLIKDARPVPTVYKIWFEDGFQALEPVNYDAYSAARKNTWKFNGLPIEGKFEKLELYVRQPTLKRPDIWELATTLAFEDSAAAKVQLCLDQAGQQFKLPFENRKLIVLNVTYVINCLDKKQSDFDPDLPHMIDKYVFHGDRLDYSLFKIPETMHAEIFTVEGLASPDDEFKPLVEKYGLKGLRFEEVWSSDE
jgi:hypothetical protein